MAKSFKQMVGQARAEVPAIIPAEAPQEYNKTGTLWSSMFATQQTSMRPVPFRTQSTYHWVY
jgi:hypothetical protein